jgi:type I restriction enzyme S subunit
MTAARAQSAKTLETTSDDLPEGWVTAELQGVCAAVQDGTHFSPKEQSQTGDFKYITAKNIKQWGIDLADVTYIPAHVHRSIYARCNPEFGDVLYIKDGATTGIATVNTLTEEFSLLSSVSLLKPKRDLIEAQYLKWYLNSPIGYRTMTDQMTGSAITRLILKTIRSAKITLAPIAEQRRIVAKIEELLRNVNAGHARLAKVPKILKAFRQSVLAAACSGRLTEDWREQHPDVESAGKLLTIILRKRRAKVAEHRIREPIAPDEAILADFPQNWAASTIDQLTCLVTSGSRGWAKYYADSGGFFIRAENINTDVLRIDDMVHVRPPDGAEGLRTRVARHDLLITITGANVTKAGIVTLDLGEAYVSQHVALVRPVDPSTAQYLYLWTVSPSHGRAKLTADAYGAGKPGLNLDNIREMAVALPPYDEQQEIVRRVEILFKLADKIEKRVAATTKRANKLTQSILAKAFRGELVPIEAELARKEGRDYEPASVLLDRIRTSRQAESEKPKPRRAIRRAAAAAAGS